MRLHENQLTDQVFSFKEPVNGDGFVGHRWLHINTSAILRDILARKVDAHPQYVPVDPDQADYVMRNHGVEAQHLARLTPKHLEVPILVLLFPPDYTVIADGNHRFVKAWKLGLPELPAFIVSQEQWEPYVITDIPQGMKCILENSASTQWTGS